MSIRIAAIAAALVATPVAAQDVAPVATVAPIAAPVTTNAILRAGTPVTLRLLEEITTK